jgi:glycosyltransferase involved in cell wall biosynthesis
MPSISVIIPAYNAEKFIGEAIESVLNQTRPAKEIIVVDDASTDRTAGIARSFGERVKVLVNEVNSGPGHSRNAGVAASTGDYLAFLDADDKWLPVHLDNLAGLLDKWPEAGFAYGLVQVFGTRSELGPHFPDLTSDVPHSIFLRLMRTTVLLPTTALVRRKSFDAVEGFKEIVEMRRGRRVQVEDYDFFLRLSAHYPGIQSSEITACYRTYEGQSNVVRDWQMFLEFKYRMRLIQQLQDRPQGHPDLPAAIERMQRAWEQQLREAWVQGKTSYLRALIRWGCDVSYLLAASDYYRWRAWTPAWALRLGRRLGRFVCAR